MQGDWFLQMKPIRCTIFSQWISSIFFLVRRMDPAYQTVSYTEHKCQVSHKIQFFLLMMDLERPETCTGYKEYWRNTLRKNYAPSWFHLQDYIEMRGQKNISDWVRIKHKSATNFAVWWQCSTFTLYNTLIRLRRPSTTLNFKCTAECYIYIYIYIYI